MAGQAKLVATYPEPFWRRDGLSGTAMSQRGPLVEIHDASGPDGAMAALFGFVGYPAKARRQLGREALVDTSVRQLARLFGEAAATPQAAYVQDWADEAATATAADALPQGNHPDYRPVEPPGRWHDRLRLAGSECSPVLGGYIEGALAAAAIAVGRNG
jgi:monoamine oxidase